MFLSSCTVMLLFTLFSSVSSSAYVNDCSNGEGLFNIDFLSLSPQDITVGTNVTLGLLYTNPDEPITDGTVTNALTYNYIPFSPSTEPLCNSIACPIGRGANNGTAVSTWPDLNGNVVSQVVWKDSSGRLLLCIEMDVQSSRPVRPIESMQVAEVKMFRGSGRGYDLTRRVTNESSERGGFLRGF